MDQRIGQKDAPLHTAASMDPGFIPGITPAGRAGDAVREKERADGAEAGAAVVDAEPQDAEAAAVDLAEPAKAEEPGESAETEPAGEADGSESESAEPEASGERPVFEAKDHRGTITVDAGGIGFTLDDQATEFTWDEVVAVEQATARFAKRLTVTVHTKGDRWYPNEVQAPDRATLTRWTGELDAALDAYFEE
ncbi:hypothetical protein [Streptomyces indicus]|uniref:Uncharacterized protein n=1 Tax=Streptomyces indicus TaxID=417292 RepID=A0A1G8U4L2_9ACTN|nr:hypothetical protein [Streptomyces indicus]SDJ48035.1 hypothetical protein SAMN05421806_101600 [Streptomyces indicus]